MFKWIQRIASKEETLIEIITSLSFKIHLRIEQHNLILGKFIQLHFKKNIIFSYSALSKLNKAYKNQSFNKWFDEWNQKIHKRNNFDRYLFNLWWVMRLQILVVIIKIVESLGRATLGISSICFLYIFTILKCYKGHQNSPPAQNLSLA